MHVVCDQEKLGIGVCVCDILELKNLLRRSPSNMEVAAVLHILGLQENKLSEPPTTATGWYAACFSLVFIG